MRRRFAGRSLVRGACCLALSTIVTGPACQGEPPERRPLVTSLSARDAAGPPRTADCRSFEDFDVDTLDDLPDSPWTESFDLVWRTVMQKHYDPTLGCLDWPKVRADYGAKVAGAGDVKQAYALMNEMLGLLEQSHLHVSAPHVATDGIDDRPRGDAVVPVRVRWLDEKIVVVDATVQGHDSGVPLGAELVAIDERPLRPEVDATLARGGRPAQVAMHVGRAVQARLRCPLGQEQGVMALRFRALDEPDERAVEVPCFVPTGERVSMGNLRELPTEVSFRMLEGGKVGYLAFNYWMLPMVDQVRAGLTALRAEGMQALVLDLRGNPGGVGAMSIPIARTLLSEPGSLGRLRLRAFTQTFEVEADEDPFTGPVVLLLDEGSASTTEIFAVGMRDLGRVKIVGGGPSPGLALPSLLETLPDGGLFQYVVGDYQSPRGTVAEGDGVKPDLLVDETRARIAAGEDPVLMAARDLATKQLDAPVAGAKLEEMPSP